MAICLDAIRLGEPAKLSMTKTAVRVLVMVAARAAADIPAHEHARAECGPTTNFRARYSAVCTAELLGGENGQHTERASPLPAHSTYISK